MYIVETSTGKQIKIAIKLVEKKDYKFLTKKRYFFNWKDEGEQEVYKLQIFGFDDVLGLISIERISEEWRIHIRLLSVSAENKGPQKRYDNIAGNLLTHVSKIALMEYGELACVSLKPKNAIAQHYMDKYNLKIAGLVLFAELQEILDLVKKYDHD